jgi:hypothetical protein
MRTALVPVFAAAVAACSGLPPEPLVPLGYGEVALGVTADMPVHGAPPGVVSLWAALGAGRGVDLAFGVDAPFTLVQRLTDLGRGRGAFVPPGIAVRKSFANGLVVRADTVFTVYGARGVVGMTLTAPRTPTLTLGGTLQGIALADS